MVIKMIVCLMKSFLPELFHREDINCLVNEGMEHYLGFRI